MNKLILDNKELTDGFFDDTRLLGIMASLKDYQFCWQINQLTGMDLRVNNEIEIQLKRKNRNYFFTLYEYPEPTGSLCHYIYNNQFDGEYLLPEFRHLDFLWMMKGDMVPDDELKEKSDLIRTLNNVQLVLELSPEKIKNKENLIF